MGRQPHTAAVLVMFLLLPLTASLSVVAEDEQPEWRSIGLDPAEWTDRPESEDSPMMASYTCLLYTSPSPRDATLSRMPSSA